MPQREPPPDPTPSAPTPSASSSDSTEALTGTEASESTAEATPSVPASSGPPSEETSEAAETQGAFQAPSERPLAQSWESPADPAAVASETSTGRSARASARQHWMRWPEIPPQAREALRRTRRWWIPLLVVPALGVVLGIGVAAAIHMPTVDSVRALEPGQITQLLDSQGDIFRNYSHEKRILLRDGEVPPLLQTVLLTEEDPRFLQHGGFDVFGVVRAVIANLRSGRHSEGASTLTMQLARQLYLSREKRWRRKIEETFLAVEIEKTLSKQQILTLYCNLMNLGHGHYGFEAAARYYYGRSVGELEVGQMATLVATLPRPSEWTPYKRPELIQRKRDGILQELHATGVLSAEELNDELSKPLGLQPRREEVEIAPYFAEEVRRSLYSTYGEAGLYDRGLRVRTTMHRQMQAAAERGVRNGLVALDRLRGFRGEIARVELDGDEVPRMRSWQLLQFEPGTWVQGIVLEVGSQTAKVRVADRDFLLEPEGYEWTRRKSARSILEPGDVAWFRLLGAASSEAAAADAAQTAEDGESVDPLSGKLELMQEPQLEAAALLLENSTGAVRAMVGGWDHERSEFNRATQARRQAGSAFKPFVFGAAFEQGFTPADTLFDGPSVFAGADMQMNYSPRNFYREYFGVLTLRKALEKSVNVSSVKLQDIVGVESVLDFARRAGIEGVLPPYPSLALGSADLTVREIASAYAAIANQGVHLEPYFIESVSTPDERELSSHQPRATKAMEPDIAYLLTHVLRGVVQRGTATEAAKLGIEAAGKTGTTDSFTDAWFAGFSPQYTLVVWVGYDQNRAIGRGMTGARAALPIWIEIMQAGIDEGWIDPNARFHQPSNIKLVDIEYHTGRLPNASAASVIQEAFRAGSEPDRYYDPSWNQIAQLPWYQQRPFYGEPKEGENMPEHIEDWNLVLEAREAAENGTEPDAAAAAAASTEAGG